MKQKTAQSPKEHTMTNKLMIMGLIPFLLTACNIDNTQLQSKDIEDRYEQKGRVYIPLTATSSSGVTYRLVLPEVVLTGADEEYHLHLQGEELDVSLREGEWMMMVSEEWGLERLVDGEFVAVTAEMTSNNPQSFNIYGGETTAATISFQVTEEEVPTQVQFQHGDLDIQIEIDDGNPTDESNATFNCDGGEAPNELSHLSNQEDVLAFANFTSAHTIFIDGDNISNVTLNCLEEVQSLVISNTTNLDSVALPSSIFVGSLVLQNNAQLQSITLPHVRSMQYLEVERNPNLLQLSAPMTEEISMQLDLHDNHNLTSVSFPSLTVTGSLSITEHPSLEHLSLEKLRDSYSVTISHNDLFENLDLSALTTVTAQFYIDGNDNLQNITLDSLNSVNKDLIMASGLSFFDNQRLQEVHLPSLTTVNGHFAIDGNTELQTLSAPSIENIGTPQESCQQGCMRGWLAISNNASLTDLSFPSLTMIGRALSLAHNPSLEHLDGFSALQVVRGNLSISNNESIHNITGLFSLNSVGSWAHPIGPDAGNFVIIDNPQLPLEEVEHLAYTIIGDDDIGGDIIIR